MKEISIWQLIRQYCGDITSPTIVVFVPKGKNGQVSNFYFRIENGKYDSQLWSTSEEKNELLAFSQRVLVKRSLLFEPPVEVSKKNLETIINSCFYSGEAVVLFLVPQDPRDPLDSSNLCSPMVNLFLPATEQVLGTFIVPKEEQKNMTKLLVESRNLLQKAVI